MCDGSNYTRPSVLELECAERLLSLLPPGQMVKFCKDGSTATSGALRLARAHTGREKIAYCGEHPFFSYDDWFIGTTEMDAGTSRRVSGTSLAFHYNDLASIEALFAEHPGEIAAVILEPEREEPPEAGFLAGLIELCHREGTVVVFDEMITGFRWHLPGAGALYGVQPDLSCFGKALSNGFALSALVGRRELMELGGPVADRDRVFLLSTTHGAENHALAASMAVMDVYQREDVVGHLHRQGARLREGVMAAARRLGVERQFFLSGRECNLVYATCDADGNRSQEFRTLFMQEMVARGILGPSFVLSFSHRDEEIDRTVEAVDASLEVYARALQDGVGRHLRGRPVRPAIRRRG
jgi:glutamate-1-semialdehyde 2,1-aminomutase